MIARADAKSDAINSVWNILTQTELDPELIEEGVDVAIFQVADMPKNDCDVEIISEHAKQVTNASGCSAGSTGDSVEKQRLHLVAG